MIASSMSSHELGAVPAIEPRGELAARLLAMPAHTNPAGDILAGWIMASMDAAAVMTTTRLVGGRAVTVAVSDVVFMQPIKVGDDVCFYTDAKRVGRTSITLDVEVWVLRHGHGARIRVTRAHFTFVAIGENGRPRPSSLCLPNDRRLSGLALLM